MYVDTYPHIQKTVTKMSLGPVNRRQINGQLFFVNENESKELQQVWEISTSVTFWLSDWDLPFHVCLQAIWKDCMINTKMKGLSYTNQEEEHEFWVSWIQLLSYIWSTCSSFFIFGAFLVVTGDLRQGCRVAARPASGRPGAGTNGRWSGRRCRYTAVPRLMRLLFRPV